MRWAAKHTLVAVAASLFAMCASGAAAPDAPARGVPAAPAPPEPGNPGKVVEIWVDRASAVTSAWLSNGILLHHKHLKVHEPADVGANPPEQGRRRERQPPEVAVYATIAGAELLETAENRGISDAAVAAAWSARSVRSMKQDELEAYLGACGASVRCFGSADAFVLSASMSADKAEASLRGVRLMLAEPVVDADELERWKKRRLEQIEHRAGNDAMDGVMMALLGPQEARARRPKAESIRAITPEGAQAWLDAALGSGGEPGKRAAPMEVAIVGDIAVDRAIRLAEVYFGSLPERERISSATFAERRVAARAARPPEVVEANWKGEAPPALVMVGFFGADLRDIADHRALATAAKILSNRLERRLPPEQNVAGDAMANSMPGTAYPGFGLFLASTHAREGHENAASENIRKLLEEIMVEGPPAEELSAAAQELSKSAGRMLADPSYWAWILAQSAYQGVRISDIGIADRVYQEMQPEAVRAALKKYWTPERSIKLIVKPKGGKEGVEQ